MVAGFAVVLRILAGLLVVNTGFDLARGHLMFSGYSALESLFTGLFVILIGIHIVLSSIFMWLRSVHKWPFVLTLDRSCQQSPDKIPPQNYVDHQHRQGSKD